MCRNCYTIPLKRLILMTFFLCFFIPQVSSAYHPDINLYDKDGELIDPINDENAHKPFSTKQTCGICHDYDEITSGYHFQQGWDHISDTFGIQMGIPWQLSNGRMGKWCLTSFRQLAKKKNTTADEIDLPVYKWVGSASYTKNDPSCGACHPGSGGLEYDRDGNRYDEYMSENPGLEKSLDGDYYESNWDKSGVIEADCFVCHLEDYNFGERVYQLKNENFQWAVVAASRLGIVDGSVKRGRTPSVVYNHRYFNNDGTLTLELSKTPDENCMYCHGKAGVKKRGFSCNDAINPDVHSQQGLKCVGCHPAGMDHNMAKGHVNSMTTADNLDNTMKGCKECHTEGDLGASIPLHKKIRPSHLDRISCEVCHIPNLGHTPSMGFDFSNGKAEPFTTTQSAQKIGNENEWRPVYIRREDNNIYPVNEVNIIYWGNLDSDSVIYPLFLSEHKAGWALFSESVADDNGDGKPEVNTTEEIITGLKAFRSSLENNKRFDQINPVYIKGNKVYNLDGNNNLQTLDIKVKSSVSYSISHNVAPARLALGSRGCDDCHANKAQFYKGRRIVDMYAEDGQPITTSIGEGLGCNPIVFKINSFHQRILSPFVSFSIIFVIFMITLHYHRFGPKRIPFIYGSGEIKRFNLLERGVHLFRLLSFLILAFTGLIMAFNWSEWQNLFFSSPGQMLLIHIVCGLVFIATTLIGIVIWSKDAIFKSYDKAWVKLSGGYLGHKGEVPAGRFNAGQKMFYWYTSVFGLLIIISGLVLTFRYSFPISWVCFFSTIHNLVAFILIAGVLAHAYLGTIANPGTWRVLIDGYVTRVWAEHHHPNWYRSLMNKKEKGEEKGESDNSND